MTKPRVADNTLFKDSIVVTRVPDILEQFQYNINTKTLSTSTSGSGTVTQNNYMAVISSGTDGTASAEIQTNDKIRYRPGYEGYAYFTAMFETPGLANSTQYIGAFDLVDGYFLGYNGTDLVVGYRQGGSDTTVAYADWNGAGEQGEHFGDVDFTKLNIFRITWGWLGTAQVKFEIQRTNGTWGILHTFDFAGTLSRPSIDNPVLPICINVTKSSADSTDLKVNSASWSGGVASMFIDVGDRFFTGTQSATVSTEAVIINFQNVSTFQSVSNKVSAEGVKLSMSSDGTKPVIIKIYKNLTISGASWANVDATNSIMQVDTAGTITPDDANLLFVYNLAKSDSLLDNIDNIDFKINPGDTVTITGQSAASNDVTFSARWKELF